MAKSVDLELKKAFTDLQIKMVDTRKKIHFIDSQIELLKRCMHHVDITQCAISCYPPGAKTYESVGRMFLLTDLEEVKNNLKNRDTQLTKRASDFQKNKEYLENNLKESEDNIREMVQQRRVQSEKTN
ncbi:prefoldin subunit 1-like [Achroia grisella]|uniref:prefoldin subunit 1-like n=1 Tax=Achroia grisella TaxID=688607 RepID=UPI0027D29C40|nr:prefoldin subunit 1-like [Achroia grisella]